MKWVPLVLILLFSFSAHGRAKWFKRNNPERRAGWFSSRFEKAEVDQAAVAAARERYRAETCFLKNGLQASCGERSEWDNGDRGFNWDPFMNMIKRPPESSVQPKVSVEVNCNPQTGKFHMNVRVQGEICDAEGKNCQRTVKYFDNPYSPVGANFLSNEPNNWQTSPGLYNPKVPGANTPTRFNGDILPTSVPSGRQGVSASDYHRVSSLQPWSGAPMFHVLWIQGGYAVHGSGAVNGHGMSGGCLRISQNNAMALHRLARRVGTNNIRYNWGGYGPFNPVTGLPACATPTDLARQIVAARQQSTRADRDRALAELEGALESQMEQDGRTRGPVATNGNRSVNSVDPINEAPKSKNPIRRLIEFLFK